MASYLGRYEPIVSPGAHKHGVGEDDIVHAFACFIRAEDLDDGFVMLTGPDRAGNLMEVGVVAGELGPVIIHALRPARDRYLP